MPISSTRRYDVHTKRTFMNPQSNRRGSNEEIVLSEIGQVGTQFDGFAHQTIENSLYNCFKLEDIQTRTGFTKLGVENAGALITRGVLIDVAGLKGVDMLPDTSGSGVPSISRTTGIGVLTGEQHISQPWGGTMSDKETLLKEAQEGYLELQQQRPKSERSMAKRILMVMRGGAPADHALAARGAAALARKSGGVIRMVYINPMPSPRVDTHDRIVSDTDREMARISADVLERLAALARELDDVPVESTIRFGRLGTELATEAEVFGADLIALSAQPRPGLRDRLLAGYLARVTLGSRIPLVLLPLPAVGSSGQREDALALSLLR